MGIEVILSVAVVFLVVMCHRLCNDVFNLNVRLARLEDKQAAKPKMLQDFSELDLKESNDDKRRPTL